MNKPEHMQTPPSDLRIMVDKSVIMERKIVAAIQHNKTKQRKRFLVAQELSKRQKRYIRSTLSVNHKIKCWFSQNGADTVIEARAMTSEEDAIQRERRWIRNKTRQKQ